MGVERPGSDCSGGGILNLRDSMIHMAHVDFGGRTRLATESRAAQGLRLSASGAKTSAALPKNRTTCRNASAYPVRGALTVALAACTVRARARKAGREVVSGDPKSRSRGSRSPSRL